MEVCSIGIFRQFSKKVYQTKRYWISLFQAVSEAGIDAISIRKVLSV
jgi:hypothetical protein